MNITKVQIQSYKMINPIERNGHTIYKSVAIKAFDNNRKYCYIFDMSERANRKYLKGYIKRHVAQESLDTWGHALKGLNGLIVSAPNIRYLEYLDGKKYIG